MGKKRGHRNQRPRKRGAPPRRSSSVPEAREVVAGAGGPPPDPAFWFGFEVTWAKLVTARFVIFGMLALDAVLQLRHAPRYGAGDFNVANLGFLDDLGPGRVSYGVCQLAISLLLVAAAVGVATRIVLPIAAVLYAWLYFGSQLDSYQHHYLISLVLAIACFVPWQRPPGEQLAPASPVRSWALRLLLVQLGIMYLWAAISKLDPVWLDGTTLNVQLTGSVRSLVDSTVGFAVAAYLVVAIELVLAFTVWLRPAWKLAAPLGIAFHLGIVATGFEIGLFAYLMCALYILVVPDRIWRAAAELGLVERTAALARAVARRAGRPAFGLALAIGVPLAYLCRFPHAWTLALVALGVALLAVVRAQLARRPRPAGPALAVLAGVLLWTVVDRTTTVAIDYYRFWGGSQRRIGHRDQAEQAYRGMLEIQPDSEIAHFYLGRLLIQGGRALEGLEHLHAAQVAEPGRARAFVEESRYLVTQDRRAEAIAKAKDAVFADPSDGEARGYLEALQAGGARPTRPNKPDKPDDDL